MEVLRTRGLEKIYKNRGVCGPALDGVDMDIREGEFISIIGSSGSGKTTLLKHAGRAGLSHNRQCDRQRIRAGSHGP